MTTQYLFPVCIAAAAHGALFFGFSKPVRIPAVLQPAVIADMFQITVFEEPPEKIEVATSAEASTAPEVSQPPRSPEPLPTLVLDGSPTMDPPPISRLVPTDFDAKEILPHGSGFVGGSGIGPGGVIGKEFLDNSPRTRFQAAPIYPHDARRASLQGSVTVEFTVDENGQVLDPRVVSSSDRVFEEATLRAVAKWRFEPGRKDGRIVRFRMAAPVVFSLND